MTTILASKLLIDERLPELSKRCSQLIAKGITPSMKVILVGNSKASLLYIKNKKRLCEKIGAQFELIHLDENISKQDFLNTVSKYNEDNQTNGLFIQLPLPAHLDELPLSKLVDAHKDVDGFHPDNIFGLYSQNVEKTLCPCTPRGILRLLDFYKIPVEGKDVVIIGRSLIVGKPMSLLLTSMNATVTLCHSRTADLKAHTKRSDIIISAVGNPRFLDSSYLSTQKNQTLIDVGINHDDEGKLCGDFDFQDVVDRCQAITPVPGGVGPLTVLSLIENLIQASESQLLKV